MEVIKKNKIRMCIDENKICAASFDRRVFIAYDQIYAKKNMYYLWKDN